MLELNGVYYHPNMRMQSDNMENRSRKLTCWICSLSCVGQPGFSWFPWFGNGRGCHGNRNRGSSGRSQGIHRPGWWRPWWPRHRDWWPVNVECQRQTDMEAAHVFPIILDMAVVVQCGQEPMKVGRFSGFSDKVCLFWSAFKGNKAWHPVPTRSSLVWNV